MHLSKKDTQMAKGIAIIGMVMLHLFCRLDNMPYTPLFYIGTTPLVYYFGLFGDICVPIFCFCSGYAHFLIYDKGKDKYKNRIPNKIFRFLINFWIVVLIFSLLGIFFDKSGTIPGSVRDFFANLFLISNSYNGAWWFVLTYILLLVISPVTICIVKKLHWVLTLILSFGIYLVAYVFRFNYVISVDNEILNWILNQIILLGTSQFTYVVGMLAYKYADSKILKLVFNKDDKKVIKAIIAVVLFFIAFIGHAIIQSLIVAPFTALAVLLGLYLINLPKPFKELLSFLGRHSTNIWLVHMFFYFVLFKDFVFITKYPILIVVFIFTISIGCSYIINFIYNKVLVLVKLK